MRTRPLERGHNISGIWAGWSAKHEYLATRLDERLKRDHYLGLDPDCPQREHIEALMQLRPGQQFLKPARFNERVCKFQVTNCFPQKCGLTGLYLNHHQRARTGRQSKWNRGRTTARTDVHQLW